MKNREILFKKIASQLNREEEELFQQWMQKSDENQKLYESLKLLQKEKVEFKAYQEIDVTGAWEKVQKKSSKENNKQFKRKKKSIFWMIAASLALVLGSSLVIHHLINVKDNASFCAEENVIQSGSDKAILTLADGSTVALQKGEQYKAKNVLSNGEQIVYSTPKKKEVQYNYLTVPRGGQFSVQLSDGTRVWLNSESKLKYPTTFVAGQTREVSLLYGEAYFDVTSSKTQQNAAFVVTHKDQKIKVLGTEFNVKAYQDEAYVYTTLVEGKVAVSIHKEQRLLMPNQQMIWAIKDQNISVKRIDVVPEISWKNGVFHFEGKVLEDIMQVLSRWYDFQIKFENVELKELKFVGLIKKDYKIEEILKLMKSAEIIQEYRIKNRTIILK